MSGKYKLIVAKSGGFCYGVNRAVNICGQALREYENCVTLGPIIHNKQVTEQLSNSGLKCVNDISQIEEGSTVIIRSHGICIGDFEALTAKGFNLIDATCPDVKKIHDIVTEDSGLGRFVIVAGQRNHPEVTAICSRCKQYEIFEDPDLCLEWLRKDNNAGLPISFVSQTTIFCDIFDKFVTYLKKECTNLKIYDTVCNATKCRQNEAVEIAKSSDTIIVIGDYNSSNSRKLADICKEHCNNVIFIQTADELDPAMFDDSRTVGVTASASTPAFIIKEVIARMSNETEKEIITDSTATDPASTAPGTADGTTSEVEAQEPPAQAAEPVAGQDAQPAGEAEPLSDPAPEQAAEAAAGKPEAQAEPESAAGEPEAQAEPEAAVKKPEAQAEPEAAVKKPEAQAEPEAVTGPVSAEPEPDADTESEHDGLSFEELYEQSIKTLHTGDKVEGIVTTITATEVAVDLGVKQSGYIPVSDFIDDSTADINDVVKVGDTVEAFITRVNDVEGMIMLSKKRLDAIKNLDIIIAARDSGEIVQGVVFQDTKGGVVVNVKGVHVFVPASHTGIPKNEPTAELLGKTVKLRINEVNQARRRIIGSIRDAQKDERREKAEQLWNSIEAGKVYTGVVKSMTSYGVFVDIGGVDGMIHISELSWTRIKQPSEVMSVGDEVSVYVISFDKENRKISLGYKKGEDDPWTKFAGSYKTGDVVTVKIVKMMPFGAFAEICPGVDGLIHISQIADYRIGLPSEILKEGQSVDVKITDIDNDRKKVSLSIRAIAEPAIPDGAGSESETAAGPEEETSVESETETAAGTAIDEVPAGVEEDSTETAAGPEE